MSEKHICKICSAKVSQLVKHLTIKHDGVKLLDYLSRFNCGEEFTTIENILKTDRSKNSPWSMEFYLTRGFSKDDAILELEKKRQERKKPKTSPASLEHWVNKGLSSDEAIDRVNQYKKDIGVVPTLENYVIKYGVQLGTEKWNTYLERIKNRQNVFLSRASENIHEAKLIRWFKTSSNKNGQVVKPFTYDDYNSYCNAVMTATKLSIAVYGNDIDPGRHKLGITYGKNGWHVDHRYSKYGGFINNIHPLIIGSIENLQLITKEENSRKGQYCSISINEVNSFKTIVDDDNISKELRNKINEIFIEKKKNN